jgi:hypothetical protein
VHSVDGVLRLDQEDDERILSCHSKNRFGPTNAVGRLKLTAGGSSKLTNRRRTCRYHTQGIILMPVPVPSASKRILFWDDEVQEPLPGTRTRTP